MEDLMRLGELGRAPARGAAVGAAEVALACHVDPDADALGLDARALAHLLGRAGCDACARSRTSRSTCPAGLVPAGRRAASSPSTEFPAAPDVMVTCDCASFDRLGDARRGRSTRRGELIWIDHHRSNDGLGTIRVSTRTRPRTCEMVCRLDRCDGRRDDRRDRGVPVRRAGDRHRPVPVRGDDAGDAPGRGRACASTRSTTRALAQALYEDNRRAYLRVRGRRARQRAAVRPGGDLVWTYLTQADLDDAGVGPGGDRRPDRRHPHGARRGRRRRAQAAARRPVQGERAVARRARPVARSPPPSAAAATGWRPATPREHGPAGTIERLVAALRVPAATAPASGS